IGFALFCHSGHMMILVPPRRLIVMAQEYPGLRRQAQHLLDGPVQRAGIAAREIATGGAVVRHEQGIANKGGIPDHECQAGWRVAWRVPSPAVQIADGEGAAVLKRAVKLAAVPGKLGASIEGLAKDFLDIRNSGADNGLAAKPFMEIRRRR